jgi:hypothetical protein
MNEQQFEKLMSSNPLLLYMWDYVFNEQKWSNYSNKNNSILENICKKLTFCNSNKVKTEKQLSIESSG